MELETTQHIDGTLAELLAESTHATFVDPHLTTIFATRETDIPVGDKAILPPSCLSIAEETDPAETLHVVSMEDEPIGYALTLDIPSVIDMHRPGLRDLLILYVTPAWRRKGVAALLYDHLIRQSALNITYHTTNYRFVNFLNKHRNMPVIPKGKVNGFTDCHA